LDFVRLLKQLRSFYFDSQRIKTQWAQEFYGQPIAVAEEEPSL
jgi:CRISPR system Cascade subunit CasB